MGFKSRGNWAVGVCIKKCKHQETKMCEECIGGKLFEPMENKNDKARTDRLRN